MNQRVCIVGDASLVKEYAELCAAKGFRIVHDGEADLALELSNIAIEQKRSNLKKLEQQLAPATGILSSSVTVTLAEQRTWIKHPERLIGIGALPTLLSGSLIEFCGADSSSDAARRAAVDFAAALGKSAVFVQDCVGMVMPRILCMLINEAYFAMSEGVADDSAIDTAMQLGTNYPRGPVGWSHTIGLQQVRAVLEALHRHFGEDRYRCAPLLTKSALVALQRTVG